MVGAILCADLFRDGYARIRGVVQEKWVPNFGGKSPPSPQYFIAEYEMEDNENAAAHFVRFDDDPLPATPFSAALSEAFDNASDGAIIQLLSDASDARKRGKV